MSKLPNLSHLDAVELVVLINALEAYADELDADDEDQHILSTVLRIAGAQLSSGR
jgi:hypothetical protein